WPMLMELIAVSRALMFWNVVITLCCSRQPCLLGMHRYRYQYRYRTRYFEKTHVLVVELPIPSTDTTHQYLTASNWPGYADTKCDLFSYLSYHSPPDSQVTYLPSCVAFA